MITRRTCLQALLGATFGASARPFAPAAAMRDASQASPEISLTIVYDNRLDRTLQNRQLKADWGFGCLAQTPELNVLFDTGANGTTLLNNMAALGCDPADLDSIVLSHAHADHTGGLAALLEANTHLAVYVPAHFPSSFKDWARQRASLVEVREPMPLTSRISLTGELGRSIVEQALLIRTRDGQIVVTGCAHPGVTGIVRFAGQIADIRLVLGGFHLLNTADDKVAHIASELLALGARQVGPSHCSGNRAIAIFQRKYGRNLVELGLGWRRRFDA